MSRVIFIKTTEACQLDCRHCFTGGQSAQRGFLDIPKTLQWAKRYVAHFPHEEFHFELHGGEPLLLDVEKLESLVAGLRDLEARVSVGCTSNLVFNIDDRLQSFIASLDSFGTSWDADLRFANSRQERLWRDNVQRLMAAGVAMTLNISLSRAVVQMPPEKITDMVRDLGFYRVMFDRITSNGSAKNHREIFPTNQEINEWYLYMHDITECANLRTQFINQALESVYVKFEKGLEMSGTFCRTCEQQLLTVNADGTIAGCPNSAPEESYGHIDDSIDQLLHHPCRLDVIAKEATPTDTCLGCEVFSYCGGDCHRLQWQGDVCAAPRQLMRKLAGLDYSRNPISAKRIIPIRGI